MTAGHQHLKELPSILIPILERSNRDKDLDIIIPKVLVKCLVIYNIKCFRDRKKKISPGMNNINRHQHLGNPWQGGEEEDMQKRSSESQREASVFMSLLIFMLAAYQISIIYSFFLTFSSEMKLKLN